MTDVVFRQGGNDTAGEEIAETQPVESKEPKTAKDTEVEPAFTLYESAKNKSFIAEYLGLGDDFNQEAYEKEIDGIEDYFKHKVEVGDMENTTDAVESLLKKAEKELKLEDSERMVVKIQKLLAYFNFKAEVEEVTRNNFKYGNQD
jgi:hypothetical protein